MGSANAATAGVGTTETATSLVDVTLGSAAGTAGNLLHLRLLGDDARATVDPAVGPTSAFSNLFALKAQSAVLPVLNNINTPLIESRAPGGTSPVTGPAANLGTLIPTPSLPLLGSSVLNGNLLPVSLTSAIDNGVAKSGLNASLADLGVVSGLVSVKSVTSTLGASAAGTTADGNRTLSVNALSVLNLGSLLKGLGIDLANLPVPVVSNILSTLKVPVAGVPSGSTLGSVVANLNSTVASLQGLVGSNPAFSALPAPLATTLSGLSLPVATTNGGVIPDPTTVTTLLPQVQGLLAGVLSSALTNLNDISLLKFGGLSVGTVTHAVGATKDSKADAIGTLTGLSVGNVSLPNVDLNSTVATVTGLVNTIQTTLDTALSPLGLSDLISVKFFDKPTNNGVTSSGGYTRSLAGITGVSLAINPPANLLNLVTGLVPAAGIGSQLTGALGTLPAGLGGSMGLLNGALPAQAGTVVAALAKGASIKIADVSTGSNFAAPATATPVTQLARTGANTTIFLIIGMLMVGSALVGRRFIPARVHAEK